MSKRAARPSARKRAEIIERLEAIVAGKLHAAHLDVEGTREVLELIGTLERALAEARSKLEKRKR